MSGKLRFVERFPWPQVENGRNWDLKITLPKSSDLETAANCWMVRKAISLHRNDSSWQPVLLCTCKSPNLKEYRSVVVWGVQGIPVWCYSVCTSMRWRLWTIIPSPSMQSFLPLCRRLAWEVPYGPAVSRSPLPALLTFPWVPLASSFPRGPAALLPLWVYLGYSHQVIDWEQRKPCLGLSFFSGTQIILNTIMQLRLGKSFWMQLEF